MVPEACAGYAIWVPAYERVKTLHYSITWSARASSVGGTVRPSALAVVRLMISSTFVALLHRQVGRFLALENSAGVDADLSEQVRKTGTVAHQAAGRGEPVNLTGASKGWLGPRGCYF